MEETREEIGMVVESFDNIEVTYKLSKKYNIENDSLKSVTLDNGEIQLTIYFITI